MVSHPMTKLPLSQSSEVYGNSVFYRKQQISVDSSEDSFYDYFHVANPDLHKQVNHLSFESFFQPQDSQQVSDRPQLLEEACSVSLEYHNFIITKLNEQMRVYKKEIETLTQTLKETLTEHAMLSDFVFQVDELMERKDSNRWLTNNSFDVILKELQLKEQ